MAANASGIRAGRAFVELGVSDSLTKGLAKAMAQFKAFGEGLRAVGLKLLAFGAGITGFVGAAVHSFSEAGDALDEMSTRTGVSVEALSELGYVAKLGGVEMEGLEGGLRKMQKTLAAADDESKQAVTALRELGLTVEDLKGLAPEQQFEQIADRLARISDPTNRAAAAMAIFGKSGTALLPMMTDGAAGIAALRKKAADLGLTMSSSSAKAAAALADALDSMWAVAQRVWQVLGEALVPTVTHLANWVATAGKNVMDWIRANNGLIVTLAKVAAGVAVAGAAMLVTGTIITNVVAIMSGIGALMTGATTALSAMGSILAGLTSPIGLVVAGLVGLGTATRFGAGAAGEAISWLSDQFTALRAWVGEVLGGIANAMAAGDIALAGKILWLGLKLAWEEGTAAIGKVWREARDGFIDVFETLGAAVLTAGEAIWHGLEVGWIETTAFLSKTWEKFTSFVSLSWETIKNLATKTWNEIKGLFDEDFNVEAANAAADQALVAAEQKLDASKNAALAEIERRRQSRRDQAAQADQATRDLIEQQLYGGINRRGQERNDQAAAGAAEVAKLRAQLQESLAKARDEAGRSREGLPGGRRWQDQMGEMLGGAKSGASGSFSGAIASGLGGGGVLSELKKQTLLHQANAASLAKIANRKTTGAFA